MKIGKKLKEIRFELMLSQKEMAEKLGVSRGYISNIEKGVRNPSLPTKTIINYMYLKHCHNKKPLVEVMTPEQPKQNWFMRMLKWIFRK